MILVTGSTGLIGSEALGDSPKPGCLRARLLAT